MTCGTTLPSPSGTLVLRPVGASATLPQPREEPASCDGNAMIRQGGETMQRSTALEAVLKRDRLIVLGGLAGITVLAWAYVGYLAWEMGQMDMSMHMDMAMPQMQ